MKSKIEKHIRKYVLNNFGRSELDDPSWNITELAESINTFLSNEIDKVINKYLSTTYKDEECYYPNNVYSYVRDYLRSLWEEIEELL